MDQLIQLEHSLLVPHNRRDKELLNRLLTDDFLEMGASGKLFGKDVVLENLPLEKDATRFEGRDFNVRYLGEDVGIVTFIVTKLMADTPPAESFRTSIWHKTAQGWQMVFHQGTPLKP